MDCLKLLIEKYPTYEKTHSAKIRFAESWFKLDDATKKKSLGTDDKVAAAEKEVATCRRSPGSVSAQEEEEQQHGVWRSWWRCGAEC